MTDSYLRAEDHSSVFMMKAFILSVIFLLFLIDDSKGQSTQISLIPSFAEKQIKHYSITYSAQSSGDGTEQILSTTKKQVKINVVAVHDDFTSLQWHYDEVEFTEANAQNNPYAVLMNTLSAGITVKYSIDNKGAIKTIVNREEIIAAIQKNVDKKLISMANDGSISSSMVTTTKFQLQMMLSTPDQVDKIILGDLFKFHQMYGKGYSSQPSKIVVDHDIIPETYDVRLKSIDQTNQTCVIISNLVSDTSKAINNSFEYKLSDYWLIKHTSERVSYDPLVVIQFYEIQLLP